MKSQKDKIATLTEMSQLTVLSNKINEVQEKNLKMYPFIVFDSIKEVKLEYDLSYQKTVNDEPVRHNSLVSYYLTLDESKNTDALQIRFEALEKWVRNLFWKDVLVEIYFNDRIVFKSKKYERQTRKTNP